MIKKILLLAGLILPVFGDTIQFSWNAIGSTSLTMAGALGSPATGFAGVSSVQNLDSGSVLNITGGVFTFTTGGRLTTPGTSGNTPLATGGTWTITGTAKNGPTTIATGTLATGIFIGSPLLQFGSGVNTLTSGINTLTANAALLAYFGVPNVIPNTLTMNLSRGGAWNSVTGVYSNQNRAGVFTNGTLAFNARVEPIPEPTTFALIGGSLAGLALLRRRRS